MVEEKLRTEIRRLPLDCLRHLEVNARYMTAEQQQRLTANIKRDGGLTSLPLVWLVHDESGAPVDPAEYEILSGNHRVYSAREAGLTEIDCIVILNALSRERRVEIQLAHNAVTGQDDLSILEQLYEGLTLTGKEYSGLSDDIFGHLKDIKLAGFNVAGPAYQEITLSFLPDDAEQFLELVRRAEKGAKVLFHAGRFEDFDKTFDAIVRVKQLRNVQNSAIAMAILAELAIQKLDELEAAEGELVE
jgi:hypothetical protein